MTDSNRRSVWMCVYTLLDRRAAPLVPCLPPAIFSKTGHRADYTVLQCRVDGRDGWDYFRPVALARACEVCDKKRKQPEKQESAGQLPIIFFSFGATCPRCRKTEEKRVAQPTARKHARNSLPPFLFLPPEEKS